jgi:hypothetical protein
MKWMRANRVLGKEIGFDSVEAIRRMRENM